jgi:MATE family multidrug resistance protein
MNLPIHPVNRIREAKNLRSELGFTLRLGGPLALGELGWMSTYIVDALMIGRLSNSPLAISASSLGNTIFYAIVFCAIYLMNGLETLIAQAYGQADETEGVLLLAQSFWLVLVGTPLVMVLSLGALWLLPHMGTPPEIVAETTRYLKPLVWSTAPLLTYMALRKYLQSIDRVMLITISLVTASLVNWLGDYAFLFGHFGFRPMGVAGSAWGTLVVRFWMLGLLTLGTWLAVRQQRVRWAWNMLRPDAQRLKVLLGIGWPSGLESLTELSVSTFMSILCARLGTILLAVHQVVLDLNAFVYQVPQGLSYATVTRVGQCAGRNSVPEVRRAANASLLLGLGFMIVAATTFAVFSHTWAGMYTNSQEVVRAAAPIFTLCAFGLLGDTTFVMLASALTGLGDTRTPMIVSLVWNWGIGMPLAYALAFHFGMSLKGLWLGRIVGSVGTAITIVIVWQVKLRADRRSFQSKQLNLLPTLSVVERP